MLLIFSGEGLLVVSSLRDPLDLTFSLWLSSCSHADSCNNPNFIHLFPTLSPMMLITVKTSALPVFLKNAIQFCSWKPCSLPSPTHDLLQIIIPWEFSTSCFCLSSSACVCQGLLYPLLCGWSVFHLDTGCFLFLFSLPPTYSNVLFTLITQ